MMREKSGEKSGEKNLKKNFSKIFSAENLKKNFSAENSGEKSTRRIRREYECLSFIFIISKHRCSLDAARPCALRALTSI